MLTNCPSTLPRDLKKITLKLPFFPPPTSASRSPSFDAGLPKPLQEYYIRHIDGHPVHFEAERRRVVQCLEAAVQRRIADGLELEIRTDNRAGLLSDITRIFRENGLTIRHAEISSEGGKAVDTFYLSDPQGHPVEVKTIEAIRVQIGEATLRVKNNPFVDDGERTTSPSDVAAGSTAFLFRNLFKFYRPFSGSSDLGPAGPRTCAAHG